MLPDPDELDRPISEDVRRKISLFSDTELDSVIPAENASGITDRYAPFMEYLSHQLGTKVTLRVANDYAAVIEGQRAGNIHIASYGSASFARARLTGVKTDAFANDINSDGSTGYYSMFFVKASSPYKSIDQLKGKNLGLVDPNSTSGNNVPRFELDKMGISDADTYFGKVVFTGSHENAMLALSQGTVEVAAEPGDGVIGIAVTDNGPGIPADILPRVFRPHVSTKSTSTVRSGLGLHIVQSIVTAHAGRVAAANRESGTGAVFTIVLPAS